MESYNSNLDFDLVFRLLLLDPDNFDEAIEIDGSSAFGVDFASQLVQFLRCNVVTERTNDNFKRTVGPLYKGTQGIS